MIVPDPFVCCLALLPLIGYLLFLSVYRLSGRPLVTTSGREIAAIGFAVCGFFAIGPAQLFFPVVAGALLGWQTWIALGVFYALSVSLIALTQRRSLSIYGITDAELQPHLLNAVRLLDPDATLESAKSEFVLPNGQLRLRIESWPGLDHTSVIGFEPNISPQFWDRLLIELRAELKNFQGRSGKRGWGMLVSAIALAVALLAAVTPRQELLVEGFRQWLFRE